MTFRNARLPVEVEQGAQGGPVYSTTVLMAASGDEQRIPNWDECRGEWDIGYGINSKTLLDLVQAHHRAVMGKLDSFRFKDWSDFQASPAGTPHQFGTGTGSATTFQLTKTYSIYDASSVLVASYVRNIKLPISSTLTIYVNNVATGAYSLTTGGLIVFSSPPGNGLSLKWLGEFDCVVRFDLDKINVSMAAVDYGTVRGIRVIEVLDAVT
jgi:uncharacterized protein (TIGR02217 family)